MKRPPRDPKNDYHDILHPTVFKLTSEDSNKVILAFPPTLRGDYLVSSLSLPILNPSRLASVIRIVSSCNFENQLQLYFARAIYAVWNATFRGATESRRILRGWRSHRPVGWRPSPCIMTRLVDTWVALRCPVTRTRSAQSLCRPGSELEGTGRGPYLLSNPQPNPKPGNA